MNFYKSILLVIAVLFGSLAQSQTNIYLSINHMFGDEDAASGVSYAIQGSHFSYERIHYYMSGFVLVHDGGQETSLGDLVFLVDSDDDESLYLGNFQVNQLEQITFSIGVVEELNHLDPSTYPDDHPLAHQNPSMHWGWTSGYRFLCLDGYMLSDVVQIHALGDANLFSQTHSFEIPSLSGNIDCSLNADYSQILNDIDISGGLYEHSETTNAVVTALENMRDNVFSTETLGVRFTGENVKSIYPNPANDIVHITGLNANSRVDILDINGRCVLTQLSTSILNIESLPEGVYSVLIDGIFNTKLVVTK